VENVFSDGTTFYALRECEIRLFVQLEDIISVRYRQPSIANKIMFLVEQESEFFTLHQQQCDLVS